LTGDSFILKDREEMFRVMTASKVSDTLYIGDWQDARASRQNRPEIAIMTVAVDSPFVGGWKFDLVDDASRSAPEPQAAQRRHIAADPPPVWESDHSGALRLWDKPVCGRDHRVPDEDRHESRWCPRFLLKKIRPVVEPAPDLLELLKDDEGPEIEGTWRRRFTLFDINPMISAFTTSEEYKRGDGFARLPQ
jgi:hypothetical protein